MEVLKMKRILIGLVLTTISIILIACKNDGVQQKSRTVKKQVITVTENSSITSDATNTKENHNSMHKDNSNTRKTTCTDNSQTIKSAYSDEQIDEAKKVAINYYKNFPHKLRNLKFKKVEGKKVMFQIYDETNQATRAIYLKLQNGKWKVTNEGY